MLIRFVVSNFLSFEKETEFNMIAGSFRNHKHHLYKAKTLNILKGSAIYGANGAGKSNLIKSIEFLKEVVESGNIEKTINSKKFKLNTLSSKKPVEFEIEFYFKKKIYIYGLCISGKIIEKEYLYISGIEKEDTLIFERKTSKKGKISIEFNKKLIKTNKDKLLIELMSESLLKENEVLISKFEELKKKDLTNVFDWISNKLVIIYPHSKYGGLVPFLLNSKEFKEFTNTLLYTLKTGVNKLEVKDINFDTFFGIDDEDFKNELIENINDSESVLFSTDYEHVLATKEKEIFLIKKIASIHYNNLKEKISFDLSEESDGTRRLLDFIPAFHGMLEDDVTFIIDEIDQSIHPALLIELINKIMADENTRGQLIFSTHESNLLDLSIFRQDEIWFAEKNSLGATSLYSLCDFKPRYDLNIKKGYLKGRFGAIPFTAELRNLKWDDYEKEERI